MKGKDKKVKWDSKKHRKKAEKHKKEKKSGKEEKKKWKVSWLILYYSLLINSFVLILITEEKEIKDREGEKEEKETIEEAWRERDEKEV